MRTLWIILWVSACGGAQASQPPSNSPAAVAPQTNAPSADAAAGTAPSADTVPANAPPGASAPRGKDGAMCGGIAGFTCDAGLFCDFPPGAHCGAADQTGSCRPRPQICTKIYKPVCGCDDKTYGNECDAHGSGISVAHDGECR